MKVTISHIDALEVLDSRGEPTVEATVTLSDGSRASAVVPSGASTGAYEAFELRDGDPKRYGGRGVLTAVGHVQNEIRSALVGADPFDQRAVDEAMIALDGSDNKRRLGANAILSVSLATARSAAVAQKKPLYRYLRGLTTIKESEQFSFPVPVINVVNGGKHASSNLDLQEFWVIPHRVKEMAERIRQGSEIFHALGALLKEHSLDTDVGNEGGYAPDFESHRQVFELIIESIIRAGYRPGEDTMLGLDAGATVFFDSEAGVYHLELENERNSSNDMIELYRTYARRYPIAAIEDPLAEEDWEAWQKISAVMKKEHPKMRIIGDDLFVTNVERFKKGIELNVANSILVKPNQIGTLSETLDCLALARSSGYDAVISHRSGSTEDTFIADLSVAVNAAYIKTGSMARGERTAKYNRLIEIEDEILGEA